MTWFVIGLALSVVSGVAYLVLFKPWRVKPLHRFLHRHSRLYRRWRWHRWLVGMKKMQRVLGQRLTPALEKATEAMKQWAEAYSRV